MDPIETEIPPERRARLMAKGQILYAKFCGTGGLGICAESFARHHIQLGEPTVARDLIAYLDARIEALRIGDPDGRLTMTEALADRIRGHLEGEEPWAVPHPDGQDGVPNSTGLQATFCLYQEPTRSPIRIERAKEIPR